MKELFKAQKIHQKIILLDEVIIKIESNLDNIIKNNLDGKVELTINLDKVKKLELDEDGSIVTKDKPNMGWYFTAESATEEKDNTKEKFNSILSEVELVIMFASLLRHKQEERNQLINDFNKLSLKVKI